MLGLAVGIAAALLIFHIVKFESSFNRNFDEYDRIVRVVHTQKLNNGEQEMNVCTPISAMDAMENSIPQFEKMARIKEFWSSLTIPDPQSGRPLKKFSVGEGNMAFFVEPSFFDIFQLNWLSGDQQNALVTPGTIVLTKSWAEKSFGQWENALGETMMIDHLIPVTVDGIVEDLPPNCDFPIQYFASYETLRSHADMFFYNEGWGSCSSNDQVFALLNQNAAMKEVDNALSKIGAKEYSERNNGKQECIHMAQPLSDLHYNEELGNSGSNVTSKSRLRILSMIGILILIMGCFNFINLATAQSSLRAKEVGIRKTLGGQRKQLIGQFFTETSLLVLLAVVIGAILGHLISPWMELISNVPADIPLMGDIDVWLFLLIAFVGVTFFSGIYPALLLSGYKPIVALRKNQTAGKSGGSLLRKALVITQFTIAQTLIIAALITISQLAYIQKKDLGFQKDLVYTFSFNNDSASVAQQPILKNSLLQLPAVESVSFNSDHPLSGNTWGSNFRFADRPEDEDYSITIKFCDEDYQDTYGIHMVAGNWYTKSDTMRHAVVNMTLLNKLGIQNPVDVIGQDIRLGGSTMMKIVGVTEDFHTHSLRSEHLPLIMSTRKDFYWEGGVKIRPDQMATTTNSIRQVFDNVYPEQVFNGRFLDESIAEFYEDERRMSNTSKAFGILAILISCLGLFGLATHAASMRVKEIGIRKVLGSSVAGIVGLLSFDFLKLVMIALLIAIPVGYYLMQEWLQSFVYKIDLGWWTFVMTGLITIVIAFLTVSYQSLRAAVTNPIESLKSE
jgi:ABC-type antimicrobial peptide transport system permease subunit